jgi:hypothetical protein
MLAEVQTASGFGALLRLDDTTGREVSLAAVDKVLNACTGLEASKSLGRPSQAVL